MGVGGGGGWVLKMRDQIWSDSAVRVNKFKWKQITFSIKVVHLLTHLLSPASPPQISCKNVPRLCVALSRTWWTPLWCQQKHLAVSHLNFIFKICLIFYIDWFIHTILNANRITAKVEAGDTNNEVVPKRIQSNLIHQQPSKQWSPMKLSYWVTMNSNI